MLLAAGTFTPADCTIAGFSAFADVGNELTITGAGASQTIVTCQANYNNAANSYRRILQASGPVTLSGILSTSQPASTAGGSNWTAPLSVRPSRSPPTRPRTARSGC